MKKFDINRFAALSMAEMPKYMREIGALKMGVGSSRVVYALDDRKVIKIAKNNAGIAQNTTEGDFVAINMYPEILPACYYADEEYRYIIVERLEPAKGTEVEAYLGGSIKALYSAIMSSMLGRQENSRFKDMSVVNMLADVCVTLDLMPGDLVRLSSWGKTKSGKIKLLDFGLTNDVWKRHYKKCA
jgi:hypothetical protein